MSQTGAACSTWWCEIPAHLLAETTYTVNVTVYTVLGKETKVVLDNALTFMAYGPRDAATVKRGVVAPTARMDRTGSRESPEGEEEEGEEGKEGAESVV